mgnify:FL=1
MKKRMLSDFAKNPRSGIGRFMVFSQLAIQVSLATAPFYAHSAVAAPDNNALKWYQSGNLTPEEQARYQQQTGNLAAAAALLSEQDSAAAVAGMARSAATGALNNEVAGWLNQFGTARVQLNLDDKFTLNGSQADVLLPLYENDSALLFTQLGLRRVDQRTTGNAGLGARAFTDNWMFGINTFYDNDFTGDNRRVGFGVEAWRDYLHLSGNSYFRLNNWHQSRDFSDYDERPANGYDIRAEGWLPAYPQLGAKLMFEQYQGDEVALFSKDKRQKDPWAFTGGVSYTPIPLLTLGAEHRAGKNGQQDSQITLALSYRPGEPWHKQINPDNVGASRHDLVERNNSIVLEYRKQETLTLGLPEKATGKGRGVLPLSYTLKNTYPVQQISWASPALIAAGGIITPAGDGRLNITLPSWRSSNINSYTLTGTVTDVRGNSHSASTQILVEMTDASATNSSVIATPASIAANGSSTSVVRIGLQDDSGQAITDVASVLKLKLTEQQHQDQPAAQRALKLKDATLGDVKESAPGVYDTIVTSGTRLGSIVVTPSINGVTLKTATIQQVADTATGRVNDGAVVITTDNRVANGSAANKVSATVTDANGNPVPEMPVTFTLTGSAVAVGSPTQISDAQGVAKLDFTNTVAETVTVKAATANGGNASADAHFIADRDTASLNDSDLTVDAQNVVANGSSKATFTARVKDAKGNPVPEMLVRWTTNGGTLGGNSSTTDAEGNALITLTNTQAGNTQVTASVNGGAGVNRLVNFIADNSNAGIGNGDLTRDKAEAVADNVDLITYSAIVKDVNGNLVNQQRVSWVTTLGTFPDGNTTATSDTDVNGKATIALKSTRAGSVQVTATAGTGGTASAESVTFKANTTTAGVSGTVSVNKTIVTANGNDSAVYSVTIKDANDNLVEGIDVNWTNAGVGVFTRADGISQTNASGVATIELKGTEAGIAKVAASVNSKPAVNAQDVTLKADESTAGIGNGDLTSDLNTAVANGTAAITYTALVKDAKGNPVKNLRVSWATDRGTFANGNTTSNTDNNGKATIALTSTQAGRATVTATPGTGSTVTATPVTFTGDPATARLDSSSITVLPNRNIVANNSDQATYSALVKDAHGNPVAGVTVTWSTNNGTLAPTNQSVSGADGVAIIKLTATTARVTQVTAKLGSAAAVNAPSVTFIADTNTAKLTALVATKTKITGSGGEQARLSATVKDHYDNPVPDVEVTWATTSQGTLNGNRSRTGPNGVAVIDLTSVLVAAGNGSATVTSSQGGVNKTATIAIRAVLSTNGKYYWTMRADHPTNSESTAASNCATYGGGRLLTRTDVADFGTAAGKGDFFRMNVSGEYGDGWYPLGNEWGTHGGDLNSLGNINTFGTITPQPATQNMYVCVKTST